MQEVQGSNPGIFVFTFFVYLSTLLLRKKFRQPFLDLPWTKTMPLMIKIRLQTLLCELDFKSLWLTFVMRSIVGKSLIEF